MPIVGGLDIHRKQLTFDYLDTVTAWWPDTSLTEGEPDRRRGSGVAGGK